MITLADVREWLKTLSIGAEHYYCGRLDDKKDKSIGVYQLKGNNPVRICLGGVENNFYEIKPVSILVHWNNNSTQTEQAAISLYNAIQSARNITIGGKAVCFIEMQQSEPVDVSDDSGVYERVIEIKIYIRR